VPPGQGALGDLGPSAPAALASVPDHLAVLKTLPIPPVPADLLARVQALPAWRVWVAVWRRWLAVGGGCAVAGLVLVLLLPSPLLRVSAPEPRGLAILPAASDTTLTAQAGQTLAVPLPIGQGAMQLHGPGTVIVSQTVMERLRTTSAVQVTLPEGILSLQVDPAGLPHDLWLMTPQAMIHVTGTWLELTATPAQTTLTLLEGAVRLEHRLTGQEVEVTPGQQVRVDATSLTVQLIPMEAWLDRKGLIPVSEPHGSSATSHPEPAPSAGPLWYDGGANR
jgi:hypothetical protein